jgi:hypothetical protein
MKRQKLYIIHAELQDGSIWHYVGITAQKSIEHRLSQHLANKRAPERQAKLKNSPRMKIYEVHSNGSVPQEQFLHSCPEWFIRQQVCPECRGIPEEVQTQIEPDISIEPDPS